MRCLMAVVPLLGLAVPGFAQSNRKTNLPENAEQTPHVPDQAERAAIAGLKKLRAVVSRDQNGVATVDFRGFKRRQNRFDIDAGLKHLQAIPNLRKLHLRYTRVTDEGLKHLAALPQLRFVNLSGCTRITTKGLSHLDKVAKLQALRLTETAFGDDAVKYLPKGLVGISFRDTRLTDAGLPSLKRFTGLKTLRLDGTAVTDKGVRHLRPLKLEALNLTRTALTDAGLKQLQHQTQLRRLLLRDTKITEAGLRHLKPFKNLTFLCLSLTPGLITEEGIEYLREALPKCELVFLTPEEVAAITALQKRGQFVRRDTETGAAVQVTLGRRGTADDLKLVRLMANFEDSPGAQRRN